MNYELWTVYSSILIYFQFCPLPSHTHLSLPQSMPHLSEWMLYHCVWRVQSQESRSSGDSRGALWRTARSLPRLRQQCVTQYSRRNDILCHLRTSSTSYKAIRTGQRWHRFVSYMPLFFIQLYVQLCVADIHCVQKKRPTCFFVI